MSRIYTRTGDSGETGLIGGTRVRKDDPRIDACGAVDELNAVLGVARGGLTLLPGQSVAIDQFVIRVQHQLFNIGAELATTEAASLSADRIADDDIAWLEASIDRWEKTLPPLREFILPGGSPAAAQLHWARAVCRRAERMVVQLSVGAPVRGELMRYLNRLSDALFVSARLANQLAGVADVKWSRSG